jgi:hypothetical protein
LPWHLSGAELTWLKIFPLRPVHFVIAWIILLSFLPLAYHFGAPAEWTGYGEGQFTYDDGSLHLIWSQITYGGDKPLIEAYQTNATGGNPIELVELSDQASFVNGAPLYNITSSTRVVNATTLKAIYIGPGFDVVKTVSVRGDQVYASYAANESVAFELTFWHWYYGSVDGVSDSTLTTPGCSSPQTTSSVPGTFSQQISDNEILQGSLRVSISSPSTVIACRDSIGVNKFVVESNSSAISFVISGSIGSAGDVSFTTEALQTLATSLPFQFAFPLAAAMGILIWRRQSKSR